MNKGAGSSLGPEFAVLFLTCVFAFFALGSNNLPGSEKWLLLYGLCTLVVSLLWWAPPARKELVDISYYSIAIIGVCCFFVASIDERAVTHLRYQYTSEWQLLQKTKHELLAMQAIDASPNEEFSYFTSQLKKKLLLADFEARLSKREKPQKEWREIATLHSLDELADLRIESQLKTIFPQISVAYDPRDFFSIGLETNRAIGGQAMAWFIIVAKSPAQLKELITAKEVSVLGLDLQLASEVVP